MSRITSKQFCNIRRSSIMECVWRRGSQVWLFQHNMHSATQRSHLCRSHPFIRKKTWQFSICRIEGANGHALYQYIVSTHPIFIANGSRKSLVAYGTNGLVYKTMLYRVPIHFHSQKFEDGFEDPYSQRPNSYRVCYYNMAKDSMRETHIATRR